MLHHVTLLAAVAALTNAVPAPSFNGQAQFSVLHERSADTSATLSPAVRLLQTYSKYADRGAAPPQSLLDWVKSEQQEAGSMQRRQSVTGTVTATPADGNDFAYVSTVTAGGQALRLVFDTGLSDLWCYSSLQPSAQTAGHQVYNPSKSTTKQLVSGALWNITKYADGRAVNGTVYKDRVVVGDATATSQAVQVATSASAVSYQDTSNDGTFGLAFSSQNNVRPAKQLTFFDTIRPALKSKLFAADLKYHAAGSWDFGYINTTKYTGSVTYLPVNNSTAPTNGLWGFTAGGSNVGTNTTMVGSQGLTIADTGTSLSTSTDSAVQAYYAKVANVTMIQGYYAFPCSVTLPAFQTSLGNRVFTVPGKYLNYGNNGPITSGGPDYCIGGLQKRMGYPFNIYGLTFLKAFYVVFDQTQSTPRLGFATKNLS